MDHDRDYGIVVDRTNKYSGIVSLDSLKQALKQQTSLSAALLPDIVTVDPELSVSELISQVAEVPYAVPVVDQQGNYYGVITKSRLLQTLDRE